MQESERLRKMEEQKRINDLREADPAKVAALKRRANRKSEDHEKTMRTIRSRPLKDRDLERLSSYRAMTDACRWTEHCQTVTVDSRTFEPRFETAGPLARSEGSDLFGAAARFVVLGMVGRLFTVKVHRRFAGASEADLAAGITGHKPSIARDLWRSVTVAEDPDIIAGWASLEHPEYQMEQDESSIQVLVVKKGGGSGLFKNRQGPQPVYAVLYLRPVNLPNIGSAFERVGCGRLFGHAVRKIFERAEEETLYLV